MEVGLMPDPTERTIPLIAADGHTMTPIEEDVTYIDASTGWRASVFAQSPEAVTVALFAHDGDYMGQWTGEPGELARWRREIAHLAMRIIAMAETIDDVSRDIRATASDGDNIAVSGETMRGWAVALERAANG